MCLNWLYFCVIFMIKPLIAIKNGKAVYITKPPHFEPGFNRNEAMSMLDADSDWDVILEFLSQYQSKPNTLANYLKEVERFALWLIHEKQKPLSSVNRADWLAYLEFIKAPSKDWCCTKQRKFLDENPNSINPSWRPFELRQEYQPLERTNPLSIEQPQIVSGLSESSQALAKRIVEAMFTFLVIAGHLNANPAMSPRSRNRTSAVKKSFSERSISDDLVNFTIDETFIAQRAATTPTEEFKWIRARYILTLLVGTGLRLSEAADHTYGAITIANNDRWVLNIVGKGDKPRSIEIFEDLKAVMKEFRIAMGCHPTPLFKDTMSLIPGAKPTKQISSRRIIQIMRETFDHASKIKQQMAANCNHQDTKGMLLRDASILEKASAHWLRHAHATYFLKMSNQNLKLTMTRLGHSDVSTTMIYLHDENQFNE